MANGIINSTTIKEIANAAYAQFTGAEDVTQVDAYAALFGDGGTLTPDTREGFFEKLFSAGVDRWYLDSAVRSKKANKYFTSQREYGAITEAVRIIAPEIIENSAYKQFKTGDKIGQYDLVVPEIRNSFFENIQSYALRWTPKGERLNEGMRSQSDFEAFVTAMMIVIDNKLVAVMEELSDMNRNNFITEKLYLQTQAGQGTVTGTHAINIVQAYIDDTDEVQTMTKEEFMASPKALLWFIKKIGLWTQLMGEQTQLFNYDEANELSVVQSTPDEFLRMTFLSSFIDAVESVALSNTFHDEYVKLDGFDKVAAWQSVKSLDFDSLSSINMKNIYNHTVDQDGVIGLIVDARGILECLKSERTASTYFSIEDIQVLERQFVKQYATNTGMNGLVLYMEDVA